MENLSSICCFSISSVMLLPSFCFVYWIALDKLRISKDLKRCRDHLSIRLPVAHWYRCYRQVLAFLLRELLSQRRKVPISKYSSTLSLSRTSAGSNWSRMVTCSRAFCSFSNVLLPGSLIFRKESFGSDINSFRSCSSIFWF